MTASQLTLSGDEVEQLAAAMADAERPTALFRTIEAIAARRMSVTVFSASTCASTTADLERIYTSRPDVYPVGAKKSKRETSWAQHVLRECKVFVGEGPLEMAAAFDDQERMASIGVRSIINVPIVLHGRCIGVLAFARNVERVPPEAVILARLLGIAAAAAFIGVPARLAVEPAKAVVDASSPPRGDRRLT